MTFEEWFEAPSLEEWSSLSNIDKYRAIWDASRSEALKDAAIICRVEGEWDLAERIVEQ